MKPEHHKEVIMQAFIRCRRSYGSNDNGVAEFEKELDCLLAHYQACIAHNEMLLARLRMQKQQMDAIGAGGVSGQPITGPGAHELVADAAEIIDTLTSNLPDYHPIREAAKSRAKQRVQELYLLACSLINVRI